MSSDRSWTTAVWILAVIALGTVLHEAATICIWIACAFFLFALLDPTAQRLKSFGHSNLLASLTLVLGATALTAIVVYVLGRLSTGMVIELQGSRGTFLKYYESIDRTWTSFAEGLTHAAKAAGPPGEVSDVAKVEVVEGSPFGSEFRATLMHGLGSAVTVFTFAILTPILTFFLLVERDSLARVSKRILSDSEVGVHVWARIVSATRAFFLGNLILGLVTYPVFALFFLCFSVPSAFTMAGLASFFNLIPFLGSVLSGFLPALTVLGEGDRVAAAVSVYAVCIAIHFAVANFVTPKVLGSKVDLNATISTIALVVWGELWGGAGLILAIPLTAAIKICFEHSKFPTLKWLAALASEKVDQEILRL